MRNKHPGKATAAVLKRTLDCLASSSAAMGSDSDLVWRQYGAGIAALPAEQRSEAIERVPKPYQGYIKSRLIRES